MSIADLLFPLLFFHASHMFLARSYLLFAVPPLPTEQKGDRSGLANLWCWSLSRLSLDLGVPTKYAHWSALLRFFVIHGCLPLQKGLLVADAVPSNRSSRQSCNEDLPHCGIVGCWFQSSEFSLPYSMSMWYIAQCNRSNNTQGSSLVPRFMLMVKTCYYVSLFMTQKYGKPQRSAPGVPK